MNRREFIFNSISALVVFLFSPLLVTKKASNLSGGNNDNILVSDKWIPDIASGMMINHARLEAIPFSEPWQRIRCPSCPICPTSPTSEGKGSFKWRPDMSTKQITRDRAILATKILKYPGVET